jgi:hypothetical protein
VIRSGKKGEIFRDKAEPYDAGVVSEKSVRTRVEAINELPSKELDRPTYLRWREQGLRSAGH